MARGPATGYIFAIKDPRIEDGKDIVYVGNGVRPWESVARHLERSSNPEVAEWAEGLHADFPEGVEILGRVVADRWHGDNRPVTEPQGGITRVEWVILDLEGEETPGRRGVYDAGDGPRRVVFGTKKAFWIEKLRAEGHPLLNREVGRPGQKRARLNVNVAQVGD